MTQECPTCGQEAEFTTCACCKKTIPLNCSKISSDRAGNVRSLQSFCLCQTCHDLVLNDILTGFLLRRARPAKAVVKQARPAEDPGVRVVAPRQFPPVDPLVPPTAPTIKCHEGE